MKITDFIEKLEQEEKRTRTKLYDLETLAVLKKKAQEYDGEDKLISFEDVAEKIKNEPEEEKVFTGWNQFDDIVKGFRPKQLITVSGITKHGKTSWLMAMSAKLAKYNPTWFLFEEGPDEIVRKFLEKKLPVPHGFTPSYMSGSTTDWIEQKVIEAIAKYNSKIIFIDQLDFIVPFNAPDHALLIGKAMRELKGIAKKWDIIIVLICHLKKSQMDKHPNLEDLKGSSSIGQESDTVILIWRETKRRDDGEITITNNTVVSVQANRRAGKTGNVKMVYDFDKGEYAEFDWSADASSEDNDFMRRITSK
jgi:replicative DNA helicase